MSFTFVLTKVMVLVALCIPAIIATKLKLLKTSYLPALAAVLMYVVQPFITVTSFQNSKFSMELLANIGLAFVFATVIQLAVFFLTKLIFMKINKTFDEKGICAYASTFANCGFMGIPFLHMLGWHEAVIYAAVFIVSFNLLSWTIGIYAISGKKEYVSIKNAIINPPTLALLVALPLFFFNVSLAEIAPDILYGLDLIANMAAPLSMLILGVRLATMKFISIFTDWTVYVVVALKLVVAPLLLFGFMSIFAIDKFIILALTIIYAMPTASSTIAFSERFEANSQLASKVLLLSSIFCVITIPLIYLIIS